MTQQLINTGLYPMDATGDRLRDAFIKCNANFADLFSRSAGTAQIINIGMPDDGTGDKVSAAFTKINANFTQLFNNLSQTGLNITASPGYAGVIGPGDAAAFLKCNVNFNYLYVYI